MDSGHWVYSGHGVVVTGGLPYHEFCLKHAPIYREIRDLQVRLERDIEVMQAEVRALARMIGMGDPE